MAQLPLLLVVVVVVALLAASATAPLPNTEAYYDFPPENVPLTFLDGAIEKGAVCLDGSPAAYHFSPGHGSGANSWLIHLQGGAWCHDGIDCLERIKNDTGLGSSTLMNGFTYTGILDGHIEGNPDFFNWNRIVLRYCDGASFLGDGEVEVKGKLVQFRGQQIWLTAIEEFMAKGMRNASEVLLTGLSAGGLATIMHCDEFRSMFGQYTKVKCMADAGLFLDIVNIYGERTMRNIFHGVVSLQGVAKNLPRTCTDHLDATSCFFAQNVIEQVKTPLFLLSAAYDFYEVITGLAPPPIGKDDPWGECKSNHTKCSASQIQILQGLRKQMLDAVKGFAKFRQHGLFINSCFTHFQSFAPTWFGSNTPTINNKTIAVSVGDWYFDRETVKAIGAPYPYDKSCKDYY